MINPAINSMVLDSIVRARLKGHEKDSVIKGTSTKNR